MSAVRSPVHLDAQLDEKLSRGLWLVKWLLLLPHFVILVFLWAAAVMLSMIAFFAILFTGRYPRGIFDYNVGVMRWSWRVSYYSYGALGTDRYPPFSLDEVEDYPTHLNIDYPERLSRGLVLVKWWLLAIPHYIVLAIFMGQTIWWSETPDWGPGYRVSIPGLIGVLVFFAGIVLLFTARYPRQIFDFVIGMNRWALRVYAYTGLMTDVYPPFRLDVGGEDPDAGPAETTAGTVAEGGGAPEGGGHWTAGRIVSAVLAGVLLITSLALTVGGGAAAFIDKGVRGSDGFLMSRDQSFASASYAITSQSVQMQSATEADWVPRRLLGDVRIEVTAPSDGSIFIGIARTADVDAYLNGVSHATVSQIPAGRGPVYTEVLGGAPATPPGQLGIWDAQATGSGAFDMTWIPQSGDWTIVLMNADGSAGVAATLAAGATVPVLTAVWVTLFVVAALTFLLGVVLLVVALASGSARR